MKKYAEFIDKHPHWFIVSNVVIVLVICFFLNVNLIKISLAGFLAYVLSFVVAYTVKWITKRERWKVKSVVDYRFPSIHTAVGVGLATVMAYYCVYLIPYAIFLIVTVPYARVVVSRKHTWDEVIAGVIIGIGCGFIAVYLTEIIL